MSEESISQAEIDALVRGIMGQEDAAAKPPGAGGSGAGGSGAGGSGAGGSGPGGSADESAALQAPLRDFVARAGQALGDLVGVPCMATLIDVSPSTILGVASLFPNQVLVGKAPLTGAMNTTLLYVAPTFVGTEMITQLYGGVAPAYLDESALGALAEGLSQMSQAGVSGLMEAMGDQVNAAPAEALSVNSLSEVPGFSPGTPVYAAGFDLAIGEFSGRMLLVLSQDAGAAIVQGIKARAAARARAAQAVAPKGGPAAATAEGAAAQAGRASGHQPAAPVPYQTAQFPDLAPRARPEEMRNIDLLMDVTLQVTVELGRTRRQIRDVLALGPGSVVELDKLAGEQVDVLVNGKLIAKGEVVVIDENYGVRITDIISPADRVQSLK